MSSLVDEQVEAAVRALAEGNLELAKFVMEREARVNELELSIDGQCQRLFALTQPVAVDLRLLLAAMRMNADLERIGDIAVNISERVEPLKQQQALLERVRATEMIALSRQMLSRVIDAFVHNDSELARSIFQMEDAVDTIGRDIFYNLIAEMKANVELIEPSAHLMALLRHIERLADHSTNIAENVIFIAEAKLMKHHTKNED
jgi:phosphate transport system protein